MKEVNVISFGGGVQTVAMAAMCVNGDLPMPDFAVMGDTGWERKGTYEYLDWFIPWCKARGLEIIVKAKGNLREDIFAKGARCANMPLFLSDGTLNAVGFLNRGQSLRQCTLEYKILVVMKEIRRKLGYTKGQRMKHYIKQWIGITLDEAHRMRDLGTPRNVLTYPFIYDKKVRRGGVIEYLKEHDIPIPPKSACIGCPFRRNISWLEMKQNQPNEFEDACEFDDDLRNPETEKSLALTGLRGVPYLHDSLKPLREVNLGEDQAEFFGSEMGAECTGFCGT